MTIQSISIGNTLDHYQPVSEDRQLIDQFNLNTKPFRTPFQSQSVAFVSDGLESTHMKNMFRFNHGVDLIQVKDLDYHKTRLGLHLHEPLLSVLAAEQGYTTVYIGTEYGPDYECKGKNWGFSLEAINYISSKLQLNYISPFLYAEKFDLFITAEKLGWKYKSCEDNQCLNCFKCFQIGTFHMAAFELGLRFEGYPSYLEMSHDLVKKYCDEVAEYKQTKVDKFYTDNYSFEHPCMMAGKTIHQLWNIQ